MIKPEISVIVTVYQAEKYLEKCLDSIAEQTFGDFEVLLVDDGSTDNSLGICQKYATKDSRFNVIRKPHTGIAETRQYGIDRAIGKYIIQIDADDWIDSSMLQDLFNTAINKDADMVICDYFIDYNGKQKHVSNKVPYETNPSKIIQAVTIHSISSSLWNKLIRTEILKNIKIPTDIYYGEDLFVCIHSIMKSKIIAYKDKALYHYNITDNYNRISNFKNLKSRSLNQLILLNHIKKSFQSLPYYIINTMETNIAHNIMYYDSITARQYLKIFWTKIPNFIFSYSPTHKKINVILSSMGLKWIILPIYRKLKCKLWQIK